MIRGLGFVFSLYFWIQQKFLLILFLSPHRCCCSAGIGIGSTRRLALSRSLLSCRICSNCRRGIGPVCEPTERVVGLPGWPPLALINGGVPLAIIEEGPAMAEQGREGGGSGISR